MNNKENVLNEICAKATNGVNTFVHRLNINQIGHNAIVNISKNINLNY